MKDLLQIGREKAESYHSKEGGGVLHPARPRPAVDHRLGCTGIGWAARVADREGVVIDYISKGAVIDASGTYRFRLWREWRLGGDRARWAMWTDEGGKPVVDGGGYQLGDPRLAAQQRAGPPAPAYRPGGDVMEAALFVLALYGIPAVLARLFVKWGIW